ncbi:NPCBM/NEW2 domain-containing protein [Microbulbifer thermotolerans]|uniref:NPCBM/NEW2 domain-containing protein n=1 Tax=Microbulbifer thermotolerans TaxID=252514 RepID=UPI002672C0B4|nr:NPCBM/NEW2 domain-containing protein [Microbulbifer thermotolerans]WKT60433.1 NPCBM/NEW2 domain-containing protein [Microbulbifer thermotolerans]
MDSQPAQSAASRRFYLSPISLPQLRLSRRECVYALLYGLVFAGAWLRVDYILHYNPVDHIWSDPQRHWEQGVDALRSDPMALTDPVLYQLYIGLLGKLTLKDPLLVAFYTALLSLVTPWIWYRFLRELQPSKTMALAGWAALSLLPSWTVIYSFFMQETLLLPLLGAALYASWRCRRKQTLRSFLPMVLLWALAGLTRGIAIPLAAVTCSWLWLAQGDKVRKAAWSLLLLALLLGPLTYRTYQQLQIFAPHGNGKLVSIYTRSGKKQINIHYLREGQRWSYWFSSPSTGEKPLAPLSDWQTARRGAVEVTIDLTQGGEDWKRALAENPLTFSNYLWIAKENLIYLFFGASWPDNNTARALDRINIQMRWLWAPLTLLLIAATVISCRRLRGRRLLPVLIATWILVQGLLPIAVNEGRYRKPAEGLLLAQVVLLLGVRRPRRASAEKIHTPTIALVAGAGLVLIAGGAHIWQHWSQAAAFERDGKAFLSALRAVSHRQQWGSLGRDLSVQGGPISIDGQHFPRGLGVHALSKTRYTIPTGAEYFHSYYGLTDDGGRRGLVEFKLLLDGEPVFSSGAFAHGAAGEILLPLQGAETLTLVVEPLGSNHHDHAAWAMARFLKRRPGND